MTKDEQIARGKLVDYAKKFLKITARPNEAICTTPEQIAAFAAQVREGCKQDLLRLITELSKDSPHATAEEALSALAVAINEGESIELWGLPDCACGKNECVYCGSGFNIPSVSEGSNT